MPTIVITSELLDALISNAAHLIQGQPVRRPDGRWAIKIEDSLFVTLHNLSRRSESISETLLRLLIQTYPHVIVPTKKK